MSLKSKLTLSYIIILSIPVLISGVLLYNNMVKSIEHETLVINEQRLYDEKVRINNQIDQVEKIGYEISTNNVLKKFFTNKYYTDSQLILAMNNNILPFISWIEAAKNPYINKFRFFTYNESIPESQSFYWAKDYEKEKWFKNVKSQLSHKNSYWEDVHPARLYKYSPFKGGLVFSLFYPMNIDDKDNTTYIEIEIDVNTLIDSSVYVDQPGNTIAIIQGKNIIYSDNPILYKKILNTCKNKLQSLSSGKNLRVALDRNNYLINIERINFPGTYFISAIPISEISKPLVRSRNIFIFIFTAGTIILSGLSYLSAHLLLKELKIVLKAVQKIEHGEFNISINVKGKDEITEIAENINMMAAKINDLINVVYKAQIAQKDMALAVLQKQINPHFIYNTLETLKMMAEIKDEEEISDGLTALGKLMRYNFSLGKELSTLGMEVDNAKDYIKIQNLMLNNSLHVRYDIAHEFEACKIPCLTLQPLIENCIVHGLKGKGGDLDIKVIIRSIDGCLWCEIDDDGVGIDQQRLADINKKLDTEAINDTIAAPKDGLALANINQRIKLYFGKEYGLELRSRANGGIAAIVKLPITF